MTRGLPVEQVLPELQAALRRQPSAVLIAPPGAGKTTAVAPALLDEGWCTGEILLLSPRRVAARSAAERMAQTAGEKVGETIGYATRLDTRRSARTRVTVMTEAIFVNRITNDPELEGVSAVLFDEAHERNLDSDLGLALAIETQRILRPDLRILVMSATIDGARFARLLGEDAQIIESAGRSFPLEIRWLGDDPSKPLEDSTTSAIRQAWHETDGDILAFLPGLRDIERVKDKLVAVYPDTPVLPLHGQVEPAAQRKAIRRDDEGRRRIVLASAIAETSLTLDGVSVVIDSGLSRQAFYDPVGGATRLETVRASQASAEQRAGRAARQAPGIAYRLWNEAGHGGRPAYSAPEIEMADLAPLLLILSDWGASDAASLPWLDPPPEASLRSARERLVRLGALDDSGRITDLGEKIASLPLDPASAACVLFGARSGQALDAARLVLLLQERGLGGRSEDLHRRLGGWRSDGSKKAKAAEALARRWAQAAEKLVDRSAMQAGDAAIFLALARPDFIAKRRDASGENWLSAGGRGYRLDPASPLARSEWIVIGDAQGHAQGARITSAAELEPAATDTDLAHLVDDRRSVRWNDKEGRVEARRERSLGAIIITRAPDADPDREDVSRALLDAARERISDLLPPDLLARAEYAGIGGLSRVELAATADQWLAPLLEGKRTLDLKKSAIAEAVLGLIDWGDRQKLDREAPREFTSAAGTRHRIDYTSDEAPSVEVRVQAMFGMDTHPTIGRVPLLLKLTSPAGRPIQSTRDMPAFWRGNWDDVRKDMKGRYPKHRWPDQPWLEKPSLKTKNAFSKGQG
ncbi:ATP-dependent helicase HrpB [Erythrobacteraceae bacterium WH01K]|nr:ATP-dependent helicase HrpB [Erythrobacteraceae bacterium WH01K]